MCGKQWSTSIIHQPAVPFYRKCLASVVGSYKLMKQCILYVVREVPPERGVPGDGRRGPQRAAVERVRRAARARAARPPRRRARARLRARRHAPRQRR